MTRFADPHRCPDCLTELAPGSQRCGHCGLDLRGELGQRLFLTLTRADELLVEMRAASSRPEPALTAPQPGTAPGGPGSTLTTGMPDLTSSGGYDVPAGPTGPGLPPYEPAAVRPSSVPKILLGLGATCLLVAALVFLAVTWSVMGVGGRTATLVALTAIMGGLTVLSARHALRGAVEAMGLVTIGLAVLDVVGARTAGWLGDPSDATFATVLGALLVGGGLAATTGLLRTPAKGFTSGELAASAGALVLFWGLSDGAWATSEVRALVATLVLGALAGAVASRMDRPAGAAYVVATVGTMVVAAGAWIVQTADAVAQAAEHPTVAALWGRFEIWPVLTAAAVGLAVTALRPAPLVLRQLTLGVAVVLLAVAATVPSYDERQMVTTLTFVVAVLALAGGVVAAPRTWAVSGLGALALGALGLLVTGLGYLAAAGEAYADTAALAWSGNAGARVETAVGLADVDDPWLLPLVTVAVLIAVAAAGRLSDELRSLPVRHVAVAAAGLLTVSVAATVLSYEVPVWTVLAALLVVASAAVALGTARARRSLTALGAVLLVVALPLSFADEALTTGTLVVALVLTAVAHLLSRDTLVEEVAAGTLPFVLAGLVWSAGAAYDAEGTWSALVGLVLLGVLLLGRGVLDREGSSGPAVAVLEGCSGLAALPLVAAGVATAASSETSSWGAVYLTVGGVVATVLALVRDDRRQVGWLGGVLLAMATWVRLQDLGVHEPEPYTLPSALALLAVGLVHLRRHPEASTQKAIGAGLALALVPSLLWVLDDPIGVRAVLLGLACLALVVAGVQGRWSAPLVHGGVVGLLVALREAGPAIGDSVPRWALIGAAGVLLIGLGVTWEARMRDAKRAADYVRSLR